MVEYASNSKFKDIEGAETTESAPESSEFDLDPEIYPDPNSIAAKLVVRAKRFEVLLKS